jgi:hypothetical protein
VEEKATAARRAPTLTLTIPSEICGVRTVGWKGVWPLPPCGRLPTHRFGEPLGPRSPKCTANKQNGLYLLLAKAQSCLQPEKEAIAHICDSTSQQTTKLHFMRSGMPHFDRPSGWGFMRFRHGIFKTIMACAYGIFFTPLAERRSKKTAIKNPGGGGNNVGVDLFWRAGADVYRGVVYFFLNDATPCIAWLLAFTSTPPSASAPAPPAPPPSSPSARGTKKKNRRAPTWLVGSSEAKNIPGLVNFCVSF